MAPRDDRSEVRLLAVDVPTFLAVQTYLDDVFRELQLVALGEAEGLAVPVRVGELGRHLRLLIERPRADLAWQVRRAAADGLRTVDLSVDLGDEVVADAVHMLVLLDEFDEWSRSGAMLTPPRSPEVQRALRWAVREIVGQLRIGRRPHPFTLARERPTALP